MEDGQAPYDRFAVEYDSAFRDRKSVAEDERVTRLLRRTMGNSTLRILDVGCGTGWLIEHLDGRLAGCPYLGFDNSRAMLARAREKFPLAARALHLFDMNDEWRKVAPTRSFDLVVSTFASPSYSSPQHFAEQSAEVLRPGGVVFAMPWTGGFWRRPPYMSPETYAGMRTWSKYEAMRAFKDAGFQHVEVGGLRHPTIAPSELIPARLHDRWVSAAEPLLWGRRNPDALTFLTIKAVL